MSVVLPIEEDARYRVYTATEGQTDFAIPFPFQQGADIYVARKASPGNWQTLSQTLYVISGAGDPEGGIVAFGAGRAGGERLLVCGAAVLDRLGSIVRDGRFNSRLTDDELDRNRLIQQEQARDISRALMMEWGESSAPPMIAGDIEEGQSLVLRGDRIEGGLSIDEIGEASEAAIEAREAAQIARDAAEAAQNSVIETLGPALPQTYGFAVGGAVQSVDLLNPAITKAHILSLVLGGVEQLEDTFEVTAGVITPAAGTWPVADMQVKVGIGLPVSLAAAIPIAGSVRNVHVADDAAIDAEKLSYAAPFAPVVRRSLVEKFGEAVNLLDFGGKGNGTFDNLPAWNDVIAHILTLPRGGTIRLPAGRFGAVGRVDFPKTAGKWIRVVGEGGGTIIDVTGAEAHAWYVGGPMAAGGTNFRAERLQFVGGNPALNKAVRLENANGAVFEHIGLENMLCGFDATGSYSLHFIGLESLNVGGDTIYSATGAHNMIVDRARAFNAGLAAVGRFLELSGYTDNLVIQNSDFEFCRQVVSFAAGGSGFVARDCYVEYCETDAYGFGAAMYGAEIVGGWLSLGAAFEFTNWIGGRFAPAAIFDQTVSFGASCRDVDSVVARKTGSGTFTPCLPQTVSSFLNGSSAGARPVTFRKDQGGYVHLGGEVNIGSNGDAVFQLPDGYRPTNFPRCSALNPTNLTGVEVIIDGVDGNVVCNAASGSKCSLDGLSFFVG